MNYDLRQYRLPAGASRLDRWTLAIWKLWGVWLRPVLLTGLVMGAVAAAIGTMLAGHPGYVAPWSPTNYAPAVGLLPGGRVLSVAAMNRTAWTRGIGAQLATSLMAALVAWPILRRSSHPVATGILAGLAVTAVHLTFSVQWTIEPLIGASASLNAAAIVALWSLLFSGAVVGALTARRSPRCRIPT